MHPEIRLERTRDLELIRRIVTDPKIFLGSSDDFSPFPGDYTPPDPEKMHYVLASNGVGLIGLFALVPHTPILWEVHTCILPSCWGATGLRAAQALPPWLWENSTCLRLITGVPEYNRLALRLARMAGMTEWGVNPAAIQKWRKLHNIVMLGISKPN